MSSPEREREVLKELDFEPDADVIYRKSWQVRTGYRLGGYATFALTYPTLMWWPEYSPGSGLPPAMIVAIGEAVVGICCLREANKSIEFPQPETSQPQD